MLIGIISDIHEDLVRLKKAFSIFKKRRVDEIICLGDIVGYCVPYYTYLNSRNSNEVISLIRSSCSDVVIGNHDLYALKKIPRNKSFFDYPKNWYQLDYGTRKSISDGRLFLYEDNELSALLSSKNMDYLDSLPEYIIKDCGDHRILLTHYAFPDCTGSSTLVITNTGQMKEHFIFMKKNNCIYGFSGNDHFEGIRVFTNTDISDYSFSEDYKMPNEQVWIHGPTVSKGTFDNGIMIYDSKQRLLEAIPLNSKKHIVPSMKNL